MCRGVELVSKVIQSKVKLGDDFRNVCTACVFM